MTRDSRSRAFISSTRGNSSRRRGCHPVAQGGAGQGDPERPNCPARRCSGVWSACRRDGGAPTDLGHTSPWRWANLRRTGCLKSLFGGHFFRVAVLAGAFLRTVFRTKKRTAHVQLFGGLLADADTRLYNTDRVFPRRSNRGLRSGVRGGLAGLRLARAALPGFGFVCRGGTASLRALTETVLQGGIHLGAQFGDLPALLATGRAVVGSRRATWVRRPAAARPGGVARSRFGDTQTRSVADARRVGSTGIVAVLMRG